MFLLVRYGFKRENVKMFAFPENCSSCFCNCVFYWLSVFGLQLENLDNESVYANSCSDSNITIPWNVTVGPQERMTSIQWYFHGSHGHNIKIAEYSDGNFAKTANISGRKFGVILVFHSTWIGRLTSRSTFIIISLFHFSTLYLIWGEYQFQSVCLCFRVFFCPIIDLCY